MPRRDPIAEAPEKTTAQKDERRYIWHTQLFMAGVVFVLMLALNAATTTFSYFYGKSTGAYMQKSLEDKANNVFSDYYASGSPFCVDGSKVSFVSRPTYDTYKVKRPKVTPEGVGVGGRER